MFVEENSSFVDRKQENPVLVVFDCNGHFQYVQGERPSKDRVVHLDIHPSGHRREWKEVSFQRFE